MANANSMFRDDLLASKRILVTGGGTGLGKVMAEEYLRLGAHVYICGRRESVLRETADELMGKHGGRIVPIACDIRDADAIDAMLEQIWADGGALTGLVNNAAGNFVSRTKDLSIRGFDAIANIVFRGTFYVTLGCGKRWIDAGVPGSVISILTTWVWNGGPFTVPSAMSKAGIHIMTKSLASEWGHHGIRLNAIAPGPFPTEGAWKRLAPGQDMGAMGPAASRIPMGRIGNMHELANLAVFLMADGCEYLTGQTIAIDGADHLATGGNFYGLSQLGDEAWEAMRTMIKAANAEDKAKRTTK